METREEQIERENVLVRRIQQRAAEIAFLILNTDLPWVDIAIQIEKFRAEVTRLFPTKEWLFELIYVNRFKRLWNDWRTA